MAAQLIWQDNEAHRKKKVIYKDIFDKGGFGDRKMIQEKKIKSQKHSKPLK